MTIKTILIADDHPLFSGAIGGILKDLLPDHQILTAPDVDSLQKVAERETALSLLLLDLNMPGAVGFSALSWFVGNFPATPVIMISANGHSTTVRKALDFGAAAFIEKSADKATIEQCVMAVLRGETGLHPNLTISSRPTQLETIDTAAAIASLTPQQLKVASMLVEGLLNKQIAYELNVKEATIKAHMTEIMRKLGVFSRTQAVLALSQLAAEQPQEHAP